MSSDRAVRFSQNPLITTKDIEPSRHDMEVVGVFNPGVFQFNDQDWLVLRVAERPVHIEGYVSFAIRNSNNEVEKISFAADDARLDLSDSRYIRCGEKTYLSTISHFRLVVSDDGIHFYDPVDHPLQIFGIGNLESYGIEDCRVTRLEGTYFLTYTQVSENGVGVGLMSTSRWQEFERYGMILPPHNKDCALFGERIDGNYYCFHRPSGIDVGGNFMWIGRSKDLLSWGDHRCILKTRNGMWDSARIGIVAAPIRTRDGWLALYHGADEKDRYCLGAVLLKLDDPFEIIARSTAPIMEPDAGYERNGFFGNVIFAGGYILRGDRLTIYYGASDEVICGVEFSLENILSDLRVLA